MYTTKKSKGTRVAARGKKRPKKKLLAHIPVEAGHKDRFEQLLDDATLSVKPK